MHRALYRKYRPQSFADVIGQPHIVRTLKNQLTAGHLSHAYLFTGSRGTGKTSCAKILAKAVNCLDLREGDPCNECEICRMANDEQLLDVVEIDAASNNRVDDIRGLIESSNFAPVNAKYKVYIVDEVHMLSGSAFNALLKTLEEPPEHIIFILATTEVHKLPATILSRCQRFDFHRIGAEDIAQRLEYVADREGFGLSHDAALLIGGLADGAMRDALSLLDVCSAGGSDVDEARVIDCAGLTGREHLFKITEAIADRNAAAALAVINELYERSKDFQRLSFELSSQYRDLMLIKSVGTADSAVACSKEERARFAALADRLSIEQIVHALDVFDDASASIGRGSNRRTAVETAVIKLCDPSLDTSISALLARIARIESGAVTAPVRAAKASADTSVKPVAPEPSKPEAEPVTERGAMPTSDTEQINNSAPTDGAADTDVLPDGPFGEWNEVLDALSKISPMLRGVLDGSRAFIKGDLVLIDIRNDSFRDMINSDSRQRANLKQAIASVTGKTYRIGPYTPPPQSTAPEHDPIDDLMKAAKQFGL